MASATARPTFSFHLHSSQTQQSPSIKPRTLKPLHLKKLLISPLIRTTTTTTSLKFTLNSIDVSKQDKPISEEPDSTTTSPSPSPSPSPSLTAEEEQDLEGKFDKKRLEERFAVLNTGIHECRSCGYRYNEAAGDSSYPIPSGLPFAQLPEDWRCPTCGAAQSFFESKSVEIAGFAENQQFGLGANALTSGQKLILIYGGLGLFFALFLSGYFLQ